MEMFDQRNAIVLKRFDRDSSGGRIHQEDICQALGLPPESKYETPYEFQKQGSRLSRVIALAAAQAAADPTELRTALLSAVTYNIISGNGDAHSKNYSLLIGKRGEVSVAPLYDTAPVMFIAERFRGTGHVINGKTSIREVEVDDLVAEARTWGLSSKLAQHTVESTIDTTRSAIADNPPPAVLADMRSNLDTFWTRRSWGAPSATNDPPLASLATDERGGKVLVRWHRRGTRWVDEHWRDRPQR